MIKYKCLRNQITIKGGYSIALVQREDIEAIRNWRNQQMAVLRQAAEITKDEQKGYFSQEVWSQIENNEPSQILLGLLLDDKLIGYGGLVHISWEHKRAEVSFLSATDRAEVPPLYSKDFVTFLTLIKLLATDQLRLNRLFSETYHFRKSHISLLESAGFVKEGALRQHTLLDGKPIDSIIHGCLLS